MKTILLEQNRLREDKKLQADRLALMASEAQLLRERIQALNTQQSNCKVQPAPSCGFFILRRKKTCMIWKLSSAWKDRRQI